MTVEAIEFSSKIRRMTTPKSPHQGPATPIKRELLPGEFLSSFEFDKLDGLFERTESFGRDDGVDELIEDWKKP